MKALAIVAACAFLWSGSARAQTKPADKGQPTGANLAAISLVKPGAEPRSVIRFAPAVGSVYTIRLAISLSAGLEVSGVHLAAAHSPDVTVVFKAKALEAVKDGGTRFEVEFADTQTVIRTGATQDRMDETRKYFDSLKGKKTKFIVMPGGEIVDFAFKAPDSPDWMVRILGDFIIDAFHIMVCWVPDEEVGVGAAWKVIVPSKMEGEPHSIFLDHQWGSTDKDLRRIKIGLSSTWQSPSPKTPKGVGSLEWHALNSSGYARYALASPSPFPTEFDARINGDGKASVIIKTDNGVETAKVNTTLNMRGTARMEKPAKPANSK